MMEDTITSIATFKFQVCTFLIGSTEQGGLIVFDAAGKIRIRIESSTSPILSIHIVGNMLYAFTSGTFVVVYGLL
jgi:hypothetical protein